MRVLYNATFVRPGGGLTYVVEQTQALGHDAGIELTVLTAVWNHHLIEPVAGPRTEVRCVGVPHVLVRLLWEQTVLPWRARQHDVLFCPGNVVPLVSPRPTVVVLQNANFVGRGRRLDRNRGLLQRARAALSHRSMQRATIVVAISDSLADEITSEPALRNIALKVVRSGSPDIGHAGTLASPDGRSPDLSVPPDPYILSVANDAPHKRLSDLAELASTPAADSDIPSTIAFVGEVSEARRAELRAIAAPFADRLLFLGRTGDRQFLSRLYRHAAVVVAASELEAWPLTLNEASAEGCPIVGSDIPPHREVADGHALFFPPGDIRCLRAAVRQSVAQPRPAPWTIGRSWSNHADEIADLLRQVATTS